MRELPQLDIDQVSKEEYNKRFDTCQKCEHYLNLSQDNHTCKLCGCYMLIKCSLPNVSCPINKW